MKTLHAVLRAPLSALQYLGFALATLIDVWFQRSWCLHDSAPGDAELSILRKAMSDMGAEWKTFLERREAELATLKARTLEIEQKMSHRPRGDFESGSDPVGDLAQLIVSSDNAQAFLSKGIPSTKIEVPARLMKTAIVNATGQNQPLVPAQRGPRIVSAPERALTIRDLFTSVEVSSNLIEFCKENSFTNNAGPQYDASPGSTEGALKPESALTFVLATAAVATLAHWIPASRQVLSDAPMLQRYLDDRLLYGLKLAEENEFLNGDGTSGHILGLVGQATGFSGGATNQTALDTMARSVGQLAAAEMVPNGFILNPVDWWSPSFRLAKDTTGRYILGDPGEQMTPGLWGFPVVLTNSLARGTFVTLDAQRAGYLADRESAEIRIAEQHADFFIRNMVAVLAEERTTLVIERTSAIISGALSFAG
jgi:HK97 family phage major capsid protein